MGITSMIFDKDWTNPKHFPTHEARESQVRADLQYLFNFIRDHFNNFVTNELVAENIPYAQVEGGIQATDVQGALDYLQQEIRSISQGSIADGAVSTAKLDKTAGSEAVTTEAIRDGAVTGPKIADGAITGAKIAPGTFTAESLAAKAITGAKMADGAVDTLQLRSYCVTTEKMSNNAITTQKVADGAITTSKLNQTAGSEAVTTPTIRDLAVTGDKIASSAVGTAKLANSAVTTDKIANGAVSLAKTTGIQAAHQRLTATLTAGAKSWTVTGLTGVTSTNTIICCPDAASYKQWSDNGVRCSSQANKALTFVADSNTTADITVNVLILNYVQ